MSDTPATLSSEQNQEVLDRRICANVLNLLGLYQQKLELHKSILKQNQSERMSIMANTQVCCLERICEDLTIAMRG